MIRFWRDYLLKWDKAPNMTDKKSWNHVLFCPTDKVHRAADMQRGLSENTPGFCGYNILPHQDVELWGRTWDYKFAGIEGWHSRTKFGGEFVRAPIVVDRVAAWGLAPSAENMKILDWSAPLGQDVHGPYSSHAGKGFVPEGGNFLFEDGRVGWYRLGTITLGLKGKNIVLGTDLYFYNIPIEGH
jgi:hypothetical protein